MLAFESDVDNQRPLGGSGGRYQPIAQIGRGGMAEVLLAIVEAAGGARRLAVLKRIWPELAADPDFMAMFLDEANLALRLNHPNVVQTYEVLAGDSEPAIAMEYLHGQPLSKILNRMLRGPRRLSLPLRLRILTGVLAGLEHAHTLTDLDGTPLEVVHRDVSPQNVFVTYDGQVKLVDFGVAKTLAASHHTRPGAIKGKLAYMAPEMLQLAVIDLRADLFAVGVMLWEMLAGRRMWHGMTEVEIVAHLASNRPLPSLPSDGGVPADLEAICRRALDNDPDRRYQTAADLELALEGVLAGAADAHARNLGKVVSLAFDVERADRQAVIDRCVHQRVSASRPAVTPGPVLASDLPDMEVTRPGLAGKAPARREWSTPQAVRWWLRRVAAALMVIGIASAIALAEGAARQASSRATPAQAGVTHAPVAPAPPTPELTRLPPPVARGDGLPRDEATRPRRRYRWRTLDEDATLPPTDLAHDNSRH